MKKMSTLALATAFTIGAAMPASAVDIKLDGEMLYQFQTASEEFAGGNTEFIGHRLRLGVNMSASDKLSGYVQFQVGEEHWGTAIDANGGQAEKSLFLRQMYLDWSIPGTQAKVRMGRHAFDMPSYVFCSPIITDYVAEGIVIDLPIGGFLRSHRLLDACCCRCGIHRCERKGL